MTAVGMLVVLMNGALIIHVTDVLIIDIWEEKLPLQQVQKTKNNKVMENHIATTIEQSKKLLELGIDAETADMWWNIAVGGYSDPSCVPVSDVDIPAWSLTALLQLMPKDKEITWELSHGGWYGMGYVEEFFMTYETEVFSVFHTTSAVDPIDAVVDMIVWLKEQKKL